METLKRMFPAGKLWPINDDWNFHAGRNEFNDIKRYLLAYNQRYGEAKSVGEFAFKSQAANYEAIRAMYEAFGVNVPKTTGIIQWMLNASWPKLYWQLYDYYLLPSGAYFGVKKGAAPTGVVYNYGDHGIYVVNQSGADTIRMADHRHRLRCQLAKDFEHQHRCRWPGLRLGKNSGPLRPVARDHGLFCGPGIARPRRQKTGR